MGSSRGLDDPETCECGTVFEFSEGPPTVDAGYLCPKCAAEADDAFGACEHVWKPSADEHGDAALYCGRCAHLWLDLDNVPDKGWARGDTSEVKR